MQKDRERINKKYIQTPGKNRQIYRKNVKNF